MANLSDKETKWAGLDRAIRKQHAIRRIKAQPFYMGVSWWVGLIRGQREIQWSLERIKVYGMDMAAPGGDHTSVATWRKRPAEHTRICKHP